MLLCFFIYFFILSIHLSFLGPQLSNFIDRHTEEAVGRDPEPASRPEAFADAAAVGAVSRPCLRSLVLRQQCYEGALMETAT